jgi:membrane dipeptidase
VWWKGQWLPVVDTHADSLGGVLSGQRHLYERSDQGQLDFPRMREGGATLQFFSCWVEPEYKPERALARQLAYFDAFYQELERDPEVVPVTDLAGLSTLLAVPGRIGGVLSIEGAEAVGEDPALVRTMYRLGVRLMSLTWNQRNQLADGAGEEPGGGGLSRAGRRIVQEMNRIGMIVDVSHIAEAGFWDVLEVSTSPPIASHSNCKALNPHRRNLSDAQIRALAERGGIQGITFVRQFLGGSEDMAEVVRHLLHHLEVVGDDRHVGLGSDFDGVEEPVPGLEDVTKLPALADALSAAGLPDETVARILGGNYIRFLQQFWSQDHRLAPGEDLR